MSGFSMPAISARSVAAVTLTAVITGWAAVSLADVTWHLLAPDITVSASAPLMDMHIAGQQESAPEPAFDPDRLLSVLVLRPPGLNAVAADYASVSARATDTRLALTLKGAVASSDPSRAQAIIASADRQQIYRPGDSIQDTPGTVVLMQVYSTHVLLENNGITETLRMDDVQTNTQTDEQTVSDTVTGFSAASTPAPMAVPFRKIDLPPGVDASAALTGLVRIQPVFEPSGNGQQGALRGLQIRHGSRQDFLAAVGLQQGDLITGIDGKALDASADLPQLMSRLSSQASVALQIRRDQTDLTVYLDRSRW